jgi:hypothetical protein
MKFLDIHRLSAKQCNCLDPAHHGSSLDYNGRSKTKEQRGMLNIIEYIMRTDLIVNHPFSERGFFNGIRAVARRYTGIELREGLRRRVFGHDEKTRVV